MHTQKHAYFCVCTYVLTCIYKPDILHVYLHMYIYTLYIHIYIYMYIHICLFIYTNVDVNTSGRRCACGPLSLILRIQRSKSGQRLRKLATRAHFQAETRRHGIEIQGTAIIRVSKYLYTYIYICIYIYTCIYTCAHLHI